MSYFETSQEWLKQSSMLMSVHPQTTRVSSKYTVEPLRPRPSKDTISEGQAQAQAKPDQTTSASFCLKTYDPVSGVCLKYKTNKAAEVGRLIASLGKLGRQMAALPGDILDGEDTVMADADGVEAPAGANNQAAKADAPPQQDQSKPAEQHKSTGGGGGGKKKKKGKK